MSRPDAEKDQPPNHETASTAEDLLTSEAHGDVAVLAKMLAAVGGAEVSQGLALDLVLNGVVEEARKAIRGSGAAIALLRDGQMICRATTGNAPDLGVRVETESGIPGACLITGNVQLCSDTDVDPRVNAEACRRLNVRSMLIAPVSNGKHNFGILEVFAEQPNAFSEEDVKALQALAQRVADSKKASEEMPKAALESANKPETQTLSPLPGSEVRESDPSTALPEEANHPEFLTSVLVVLVIAVAIVLGVVIGVGVTKRNAGRAAAPSTTVSANSAIPPQPANSQPAGVTSAEDSSSSGSDAAAPHAPGGAALEPPMGGLIVTQNGKVVYRSDAPIGASRVKPERFSGRLLHRVDPIYPPEAQAQRIEGSVVLNAHVSGDGSVGEVEILSGPPLLAQAATQAVRQWKYQPYYVNRQPVERQERITIKFSLSKS